MSDQTARETPREATETEGPASGPPSSSKAASDPTSSPGKAAAAPGPDGVSSGDADAKRVDAEPEKNADAKEEPEPDAKAAPEDAKPGLTFGAPGRPAAPSAPNPEPAPAPPRSAEVSLRIFGRTDVGQVREHNEDNFIVADLTKASRGLMEADRRQIVGERGALIGVCDGMGGAAAGEVASQLAVDIIYQRMQAGAPPKGHDELAARLVHAIEAAGLRIFSEAKLDRTRRGMGTTSTIAALMDDHLFFGQVGDSRAYILRGDRLVQVTRDQSLVNQLIEAGQLTEEEAETFEHNNIILQALGTSDTVQVDLTYVHLRKGDTLMLCSDGLSGMVRNDEIREILRSVDDPLEACKVLTDRANQAGGHDNITVVVAKFDGEGLEAPTRDDIEGLRYQKYHLPESLLASVSAAEPARRVKELEEKKISQRPPTPKPWSAPDSDLGEDRDPYDDELDDERDEDEDDDRAAGRAQGDDPITIPTEGAPQWLVIMMIASAVACVTIAGYYLLR
ncbi:MAG: Stp1/IreP family PP2C-type Ser/Thr phosphatase [Polyangiaceae bacterium]|nr:Stp1/IreP family PP2C-type Ser/Thr phosphatase [Polyangiaceae bacterium]